MKSNHVMVSAASRIAPFGVTRDDIERMLDAGLKVAPTTEPIQNEPLNRVLNHIMQAQDCLHVGYSGAAKLQTDKAIEILKVMGAKPT